jgi:hypothetical protein
MNSTTCTADIRWLGHFEEGLRVARDLGRPVLLKPLGQGLGSGDNW